MRRLFDHTVAAQQVAFNAFSPGRHVRGRRSRRDALPRAERPAAVLAPAHRARRRPAQPRGAVLDLGDHTPVEPGMVFTIEPGLYAADVGGFRHSDTIAVTPDGIDILTDYPSDIESLTIPA
jgi:Xaa-Pro dipeptidase